MVKLPCDEKVEKAILGAMLFDEDGLECGLSCLKADDFYFINNKNVFSAIISVKNKGYKVDYVTVSAMLEGTVSAAYIVDLFSNTITSAGIKNYCNLLLGLAYRRRSIMQAEEIIKVASTNDIERLDKAIETLKTDTAGSTDVENVPSILESALKDIASLKKSGKKISGYATGLYDLDDLISGFEKKKLFIIAGRPAMGKSSVALNICQYIAKNNKDKNVVFFSLEMPKKDIALKLYSTALNINNEHFKFNMLTPEELVAINNHTEKFSEDMENFYVEDDMNVTIFDIQRICRNIKNKSHKEMALIVIDYLQIIKINDNGNRATDLGEVSRLSVMLAKEFDCPVVLLSQVNRGCELRQNKRPVLADLKESGNIEQDADTVIFIYRDEYYDPKSKDIGKAEFIVAKQRNGSLGTIKTIFDKKTTTFKSIYR